MRRNSYQTPICRRSDGGHPAVVIRRETNHFRCLEIATHPPRRHERPRKKGSFGTPRWRLLNETYFFGEGGATSERAVQPNRLSHFLRACLNEIGASLQRGHWCRD